MVRETAAQKRVERLTQEQFKAYQESSKGEKALMLDLLDNCIDFKQEYHFHPTRKWRADFWIVGYGLLVEVEGGIGNHNTRQKSKDGSRSKLVRSRHLDQAGFDEDSRKYAEAERLGYHVLRFSTKLACNGEALAIIKKFIEYRKEHPELIVIG